MIIRELLLNGKFELPQRELIVECYGEPIAELTDKFIKALWFRYLLNKGSVSSPYWCRRFPSQKLFNDIVMWLDHNKWIIARAIPSRNWGEISLNEDKLLQYVSPDELAQIRAYNKFNLYILEDKESTRTTTVRLNGRTTETGLVREGFQLAGNVKFKYDTKSMYKYKDSIGRNLTKSMDKIKEYYPQMRSDQATYDNISIDILNYHMNADLAFTRGNNDSDSRGRAISSSLAKVANPISCKDFRALLVIPE